MPTTVCLTLSCVWCCSGSMKTHGQKCLWRKNSYFEKFQTRTAARCQTRRPSRKWQHWELTWTNLWQTSWQNTARSWRHTPPGMTSHTPPLCALPKMTACVFMPRKTWNPIILWKALMSCVAVPLRRPCPSGQRCHEPIRMRRRGSRIGVTIHRRRLWIRIQILCQIWEVTRKIWTAWRHLRHHPPHLQAALWRCSGSLTRSTDRMERISTRKEAVPLRQRSPSALISWRTRWPRRPRSSRAERRNLRQYAAPCCLVQCPTELRHCRHCLVIRSVLCRCNFFQHCRTRRRSTIRRCLSCCRCNSSSMPLHAYSSCTCCNNSNNSSNRHVCQPDRSCPRTPCTPPTTCWRISSRCSGSRSTQTVLFRQAGCSTSTKTSCWGTHAFRHTRRTVRALRGTRTTLATRGNECCVRLLRRRSSTGNDRKGKMPKGNELKWSATRKRKKTGEQ